MEAYQQRMLDERNELQEKISKLEAFMMPNTLYQNLSIKEEVLMREQYYAMLLYIFVLSERIKIWSETGAPLIG